MRPHANVLRQEAGGAGLSGSGTRRLAGAALAGLALLGAGAGLGWWLRAPPADNARAYSRNRLIAVQVHLDEARAPYVFLAGDSQSELQPPSQRPCGGEIVNGGVSGADAGLYAELLPGLRFPVRPAAAVLTIGTNDILAKKRPRSPEVAARFEAQVERIVVGLKAATERVVVTALPPVGANLADRLDAAAVPDYSARLERLCARLGCRFADPYAALRAGDTGLAKPGAMRDGLHLSAYRPALRALEATLCAEERP